MAIATIECSGCCILFVKVDVILLYVDNRLA
jgi:hypothetical protein